MKGKWYYPKEDFSYNKVGIASWYGSAFHGRLTANGEVYDQMHLSAAHPTFPLPSYARVTNTETGSSVIVRVNDRGPYHEGRIIDLSNKTADMLDLQHSGTGKVRVQYVGRARMDGHDMPYLMASYVPKGSRIPGINPGGGQIASGVMVASNSKRITADQTPELRRFHAGAGKCACSGFGDVLCRLDPERPLQCGAPTPMPVGRCLRRRRSPAEPFGQADGRSAGIGPLPIRASLWLAAGRSLAMGYQEDGAKTVTVELAFDAVMVRNDGLTQESILASFKRQKAARRARQVADAIASRPVRR